MIHLLLAIIYLSFISLGLPDSILGAAWPSIYPQFHVPISYAGIVAMIIALGTTTSSLQTDRLVHKLGTGKVTVFSVALTAIALLGFSLSGSFWMLCLWAIPYGLGAGSVDASLNNYVALHFSSRHMSWLHCMWGVGASVGPYIMGYALTAGAGWQQGYRIIAVLQIVLVTLLLFSLPLWKRKGPMAAEAEQLQTPMPLTQVIRIPGAKAAMATFFCYCALEQTAGLWASSYLALCKGVPSETAAFFGSMFFLGVTVGRGINGFLAIKFTDTQLVRMGLSIIAVGLAAMLLPLSSTVSLVGLVLVGLGCAPIYPCLMHATPSHFGEARSQTLMGVQTASASLGCMLMPPLFGLIANHIHIGLLTAYLLIMLVIMVWMHEKLLAAGKAANQERKKL